MAIELATDREYVSRYAAPTFGITVYKAGVPGDADANAVEVSMVPSGGGAPVFTRAATRESLGTYTIHLLSSETATPGDFDLMWTYGLDGDPLTFASYIEVGRSAPAYDALPPGLKLVVEQTWNRFRDLFDSETGGPHLQTYMQANFGRNRLAQLLAISVGKLNTMSQPHQSYGVDAANPFPVASWGPLLEQMLYLEVIRHLRRSYVEQPLVTGGGTSITTLDRRDYLSRWAEILDEEKPQLDSMLAVFKIANMGLGQASVMVAGGIYGELAPSYMPGMAAARPRYYYSIYA